MKRKVADMSPTDIRVAMLTAKPKVTQAGIARKLHVTQESVYRVIEGHFVSDRIRKEIADQLGIDIRRIWPSTYLYGGGPRKAGRPKLGERKAA